MLYLLNIAKYVLNIYQTNDAVSEIHYVAVIMGSETWEKIVHSDKLSLFEICM